MKVIRVKGKIEPFGPVLDTCVISTPKRGKTYSKSANS